MATSLGQGGPIYEIGPDGRQIRAIRIAADQDGTNDPFH